MPGKKWCQYCRINLPFQKKAIQEHETTRLHIQNKEKSIKFQRIKIQRQQKAKKQMAKANNFTSTANIPKAKKGSQLQMKVQQYKNDVITSGKMAIHKLIAQKTKGLYGAPIQYPQKQDLVLAQNFQDQQDLQQQNGQQKFQMWKVDICQETGKACFINRISKAKLYEPPKGYIMSEQQKQEWQYTNKLCEQVGDQDLEKAGVIGEWQQVQQQDYYKQNEAQCEESQSSNQKANQNLLKYEQNRQVNEVKQQKPEQIERKNQVIQQLGSRIGWIEQLQQKIDNNQLSESEVISTMLSKTLVQCRSVKQKNQTLKKLVKNDFQIRATLNNHDKDLLKQEQSQPKKSIGIKPRKKVKVSQIVEQKDLA